jgi:hypothetical protein
MKLTDPFGRLESRYQKGYETMRAALREAGIETPQAARDVIRQAWRRGVVVMAVGLSLLLVVAGLLPKATPLAVGLGLFLVVWVSSSTINGQRYVNRYIDEELDRR